MDITIQFKRVHTYKNGTILHKKRSNISSRPSFTHLYLYAVFNIYIFLQTVSSIRFLISPDLPLTSTLLTVGSFENRF